MEKTMCPCTDSLIPVYTSGTDNADGGLLLFHHPRLYTTGMGTQEPIRLLMNIKSVLHIPRRVIFRKIQGSKIMPVVFDLRTLGNGKPQPSKNMNDLVAHQGDRMMSTQWQGIAR